MTKRIMKKLAFLLSIVMVVSLFANLDFAVFADEEGKKDITVDNYVQDENGEYCYSVSSGDAYGAINVPGERYHLIVEDVAVTADTVVLESGACLEILGDGALNFSGSGSDIQASDGALMMLQSKENKPSVIEGLYDIFHNDETDADEEVDIYADPGEPEWQWITFRYTVSESGAGKWYVLPEDGPEPGTLCVRYDNQDGGSVTWGETTIESEQPYSFIDTENSTQPSFKAIDLTFHTPADIDNTQIQVRVNGMDFYNNGETYAIEDEYMNGLFGDSTGTYFSTDESGNVKFTYIPSRDDAVDIEVIWLRPGGPGEGEENNQYNFERLQEELNGTYFAFGDINDNGSADTDDLKYGVMRTLYDGFRVNEGRYQREGAALGLIEDFNKQDPTNLNQNMNWLLSSDENRNVDVQISQIQGDSIAATDKSGVSHSFDAYRITIRINAFYENRADLTNFPAESEKVTLDTPIELEARAYLINMTNSSEQVIIKVKNQCFVRDAYSDPNTDNENDLEQFEGLNARALILIAPFDTVEDIVLFGNYASATETFSDETSDRYYASGFGTGDGVKYLGDKFIVMKPEFLGVTINGTGEDKTPLAWSVESSLSVAETGENTETDIYFGFDSVQIAPVSLTGLSGTRTIAGVEVLDGIPENAVQVEETSPGSGKYTVHFLSDYYDTVRIKVTYNTGSGTESGVMTLNRVGIMIQSGRTSGDTHTVGIFHGHVSDTVLDGAYYDSFKAAHPDRTSGGFGVACYATYYYPTDSNAVSPDTSLFVTYTYKDGRVERKLLESDYFTPATGNNVAMSDYILYMGDEENAPKKVEAIAIPNKNSDGTINGAKLGAGKGVEGTFNFED